MELKILCKGDFSQGSDMFSSISRGKQCVSNCLIYLLKTLLSNVHDWTKHDLHNLMKHGDEMYRNRRCFKSIFCTWLFAPKWFTRKLFVRRKRCLSQISNQVVTDIHWYIFWKFCWNSSFFKLENAILSSYRVVDLHITFWLLKEVQLVYFMMEKSLSYLIPTPEMNMADVVQREHAF